MTFIPNVVQGVESASECAILVHMTTNNTNTTTKTITVSGRTFVRRYMSELVKGDIVLAGYDRGVNLWSGKPVNFLPMKFHMENSAIRAKHSVRRHEVDVTRMDENIIRVMPVNTKHVTPTQYKFVRSDKVWVEVK